MLYVHSLKDTKPYIVGTELVVCNRCGEGTMGHDRVTGECFKFRVRNKRHGQLESLR